MSAVPTRAGKQRNTNEMRLTAQKEITMTDKRMESMDGDAALQVRRRMTTRGRRRLVKRILERSAQRRRLVAGGMAAGATALLASLLVLGEAAAMVA